MIPMVTPEPGAEADRPSAPALAQLPMTIQPAMKALRVAEAVGLPRARLAMRVSMRVRAVQAAPEVPIQMEKALGALLQWTAVAAPGAWVRMH